MAGFNATVLKPVIDTLLTVCGEKHLCYFILGSNNVKALNREAEVLEAKKRDVEKKIQRADTAVKKPTSEVEGCMKRVEDLQPKVESILTNYNHRNCMLLGICSLNCFSNHFIGMRAAKELPYVENEIKLISEVTEFTVKVPSPKVQEFSTSTLAAGGGEIESKLKWSLDFVRDDRWGMLGIWGMGGVGTTTLFKQINNALAKDPSLGFDQVIFIRASGEWATEKLQKLIMNELNLPKEEDPYKSILHHLKCKSFLVLLDDLWEWLDGEPVGLPLPFGVTGEGKYKRKMILALWSQLVCHKMEAVYTIRVGCLSTEAARLLFHEKIGEEAINSHPSIPKLADMVADECDGLPQALVTNGRAMAGTRDVNVWENAIGDLRKSKTNEIAGDEDDLLPLLKFSYDHLKDEDKQRCLLHCALWPEEHQILKDELIQCWIGHGLFNGHFGDIREAYNKGLAIIDGLQKACLLEHVEAACHELNHERVKLHDLIWDMALWIARDCGKNENKWVVLACNKLLEAPQDARIWSEAQKMSLVHNSISRLPSRIQRNIPNLATLMLQRNKGFRRVDFESAKYFNAPTRACSSRPSN